MGRDRWISRWSLAAAIALHCALFAALVVLPAPRHPREVTTPREPIEIAVVDEPPAAPEPSSPSPLVSLAMAVPHEAHEPEATEARATGLNDAPPAPSQPVPAPESTAPFRGVTMGAPSASPPHALGLELGAPNRFATGEGAAASLPAAGERPASDRPRTAAETKQAVEAALREPARKRERELGLGPEGPVLAALGEGAAASASPVQGRAVFLAIADATGMIVGIDVVECDGARAGWAQAAELARTALKGKKLRLPSTAKRAEMRIEVTSAWKLPSGHDPGADVTLFGLPVAKGEGKQSTKVSILDPIPKIRVVELAPDIKVPILSVNADIISVAGDSANIGAKPRRIVHTRLIDSKVL